MADRFDLADLLAKRLTCLTDSSGVLAAAIDQSSLDGEEKLDADVRRVQNVYTTEDFAEKLLERFDSAGVGVLDTVQLTLVLRSLLPTAEESHVIKSCHDAGLSLSGKG